MTGRRSAPLAAGLLGVSVTLAVAETVLAVRTAGAALPPGMKDETSALFVWLVLSFSGVGAVVAVKRPANPIGWLLLAEGLLWQVNEVAGDLRIYTTVIRPKLPGDAALAWVYDVMWILPAAALPLLFLLFPTGRPPSRRWRWVLLTLILGVVLLTVGVGLRPGRFGSSPGIDNPLGVEALGSLISVAETAGNLLVASSFVAGLASLVVRYRRSDAIARQQLKWLALAVGVIVAAWSTANVLEASGTVGTATLGTVRTLPLVLVPLACGIAVLKYRLYDIDLVVNRLLVYTGLAAFVVALYVGVVVGVGHLVGSGDEANVGLSVAATAVAALTFDPARRALQRVASRAVYGRRASPYEALASMTRRVASGYLATDVLGRMARSIAEATGGRGEVWVAEGDSVDRWACWPPPVEDDTDRVSLADPPAIIGRDATFPVRHGDQVLGALTVTKTSGDHLRPAEQRLLVDLADSAALILENVRLVGELRSSRQRLVTAQDSERRRVERDLHDGAQQRLLELSLTLHRAERQLPHDAHATGTLADASKQLQQALAELRDLARGIHPAILTEQGLVAAVESLADRAPLPVDLDLTVGQRLDPTVESTTYFLTSEAVTNIVKHAGDARASITIRLDTGVLEVEIVDDGAGGADPTGSGLRGLADRVAALDGQFQVASEPGHGTRIRATLPCG